MTKVKVEFFKYTGKWYSSFEFETKTPAFEMVKIKEEAKHQDAFIDDMSFTIEVDQKELGWNKYLFLK